jgi:uncharacterized membrane protein
MEARDDSRLAQAAGGHGRDALPRVRIAVSFAVGVVGGVAVALAGQATVAPLAGWDIAGLVYLAWMWRTISRLDAEGTARRAVREEPSRVEADTLLLVASVVSLGAVGLVLIEAGNNSGASKDVLVAIGVVSVVIGWTIVHTVFTLRYARLYYGEPRGGIDFNEREAPRYTDFAYLAFTVGMTFQVSDTDLQTKLVRANVLRHALLSYLFGAVIVATTINLIAGLTK